MFRYVGVVVVALLLAAWGTLSDPIRLPPGKEPKLRKLITDYGTNPGPMLAELDDRSGPHPIHQFIAYQAWLLLSKDPAYADGQSGFPTGDQINAWDGIERVDGFMQPRKDGTGSHLPGGLGPNVPGVGGASADAERAVNGKGFNKLYNGRAHYYNPWLDNGDAPKVAGANFSRLVHAIVEEGPINDRAHYAAYLAHYLADVTSAKHADAFTLDNATVLALTRIADKLVEDKSLMRVINSNDVSEAVRLLQKRVSDINHGVSEAYWQRIEARIANPGGDPILKRGTGPLVDIPESSLRTAAACYLDALGNRPPGQTLDQFFTYFDPLYFNGPILDPATDDPVWQMCTAFSEHLRWETNPAHYRTVLSAMAGYANVWRDVKPHALTPAPGFYSADPAVAPKAMETTIAELTKACSKEVHGEIGSGDDFAPAHEKYLEQAVRCVYAAYRASITALRVEAFGRKLGEGTMRLWINVKNLAGQPAALGDVKVMYKGQTRPGWTVSYEGHSVAASDTVQIRMKVSDVPADAMVEDLTVDVHGQIANTPDAGWRRAKVQERSLEIRGKYSKEGIGDKKGPIDVIVVFDTTGSMQSSIDSMRKNAIATIKRLKEHSDDVRLAVTTFRDLKEKEDIPHFAVKGFTSDLDSAFAFMNSLKADGGGDKPEDQLHGISLGLELWEKEGPTPDRIPNKIIIVVTDAAAKSPDSMNNTFKTIAKRAYEVDPAHIYPIVVGSDPDALAHAKEIAESTGGKVLRAATGDEVAAALLDAVSTAETTYAAEAASPSRRRSPLTSGGIAAIIGGVLLAIVGLVLARRKAAVADV